MRLTNITAACILGASLALPVRAQEPEAPDAPAEQATAADDSAFQAPDLEWATWAWTRTEILSSTDLEPSASGRA